MAEARMLAVVCTSREAAAARDSLAAVAAQARAIEGAAALVVTSGLSAEARAEHTRVAAELGATVLEAGPGLSVARNRALGEAGDQDVLAFVDDDAIPHADWLERLAARWDEAAPEVCCIGGAIEARLEADAPRWFSERIASAYSLLDRGPGLVELSPAHGEDAWGANVSFRAAPLRRIGGFDPRLGPWPGVPMFGDETDAERRLERAGLGLLYAGDVRVDHLLGAERLTLRGLGRREYWRGVSSVLCGDRAPAGGLPRALKAKAGFLVAAVRGDWPLAGARWARAWREWGVATAPLRRGLLRRRGWPG